MASPACADALGLDAAQSARYEHLIHELRCLVCQNETIADSHAPLALDLREQVRKQIAEGRSDDEVLHYLTDRYGDFVLYNPPFKAATALLWLGPFALLLLALIVVIRAIRKRPAAAPPRVVSPEEVQRILAETQAALAAQDAPEEKR
jgi:cytochrome c-type biogenesis protein CcmH